jgi:hypothetical protein
LADDLVLQTFEDLSVNIIEASEEGVKLELIPRGMPEARNVAVRRLALNGCVPLSGIAAFGSRQTVKQLRERQTMDVTSSVADRR